MTRDSGPMRHRPTCTQPTPKQASRVGSWLITRCPDCRAVETRKSQPAGGRLMPDFTRWVIRAVVAVGLAAALLLSAAMPAY